jgi:SAM-dependent methyltransferase
VNERLVAAGRRFARVATRAVVANPRLWPLFRRLLRTQFDALASSWEGRRGPESVASLEIVLDRLATEPRRILDLGTGTGLAARRLAQRYPGAQVVGVDLSPAMIEVARRESPSSIRFDVADASRLPYENGAFDLVVLLNMIPFFDELDRVTARGGSVVFASSNGPQTPIYVPSETLRRELGRRGFTTFEDLASGTSTALLARRASVPESGG